MNHQPLLFKKLDRELMENYVVLYHIRLKYSLMV